MPREPRARRGRLWGSLSPRPLVAVAAACALLAVGVVAGLLVGSRGPDTPAGPELTLRPLTAEASAGGTARVRGTDPGTLEVTVHGLEATGDDRFYELWLMDSGARNLVSLGSFAVPASGAATVQVPLPADVTRFGYVDLSLEPADGDPAHSGDSVLRGATS
jgi:anti-sigma-K factor RskA